MLILCVTAIRPPLQRDHTRHRVPELRHQFSELHRLASRYQSKFRDPHQNSAELLKEFKTKTHDIFSKISATVDE